MTSKQDGVERVEADGKLLAIIVKKAFNNSGYNFFSPVDFPFQLGVNFRKKGEHVPSHQHIPFSELFDIPVQEFIYIESGKMELKLFHKKKKCKELVLNNGDMVLLNCGHEVKFLEDTKMIEVKQGPYRGKDGEKEYF